MTIEEVGEYTQLRLLGGNVLLASHGVSLEKDHPIFSTMILAKN